MNMQQLFPHLGKVISGIGSRQFARLLHEMITASLPVDATHVIQGLGRSTSEVAGPHAVGAFGGNLHQVLNPGIDSRRLEPVMLSPTELADTRVDRSIRFESPAYNAQEKTGDLHPHASLPQVHLAYPGKGQYVLSVYRSPSAKAFTSQERARLKDLSWVVLPIVKQHIATVTPTLVSTNPSLVAKSLKNKDAMEGLRQRFLGRLEASALSLSSRETEVCVGLLAGLTVPQLAERLDLKVSTVESYFKRAAVKMGIAGRSALLRWLHAEQRVQHPIPVEMFQAAV
ncbi:DNA-binding CsgD family transcriptional regulator [Pseudomonas sp. PvP027]|uniref:helix-turn-helix transcriptional regulator n=1 Tax=Pseudomonas TaxID=286 RepID=UPI0001E28B62|nr:MULTISPECIES: helix-turn-helix transcriptional regulator [Pseudomonas]MBC8802875.1 helix-turn-helix transcriptional regulator [Pseudomonas congelans]MBP1143299.1 DNA-binding CsgD family transcriptional regulator [Pseudomonas sp. PvP027]